LIKRVVSDLPVEPDTFLQINDQINTVLNRYEAFKKGDFATSSNPIPVELSSGSSGPSAKSDLSLIDFDASMSPKPIASTSAQEELASLFGPSSASAATKPAVPGGTGVPPTYSNPVPTTNFGMGMGMGTGMGMTPPHLQMPAHMGATPPQMFPSHMPPTQPQHGMMGMGMGMGMTGTHPQMMMPMGGTTGGAQQMYASPIPSTHFGMGMTGGAGSGSGTAGTPPMNHFAMPAIQLSATPPLQPFGAIQLTDNAPRVPSAGPSAGGMTMVSQPPPAFQQQLQPQQPNLTPSPSQGPAQSSKDPFADLVSLI